MEAVGKCPNGLFRFLEKTPSRARRNLAIVFSNENEGKRAEGALLREENYG